MATWGGMLQMATGRRVVLVTGQRCGLWRLRGI